MAAGAKAKMSAKERREALTRENRGGSGTAEQPNEPSRVSTSSSEQAVAATRVLLRSGARDASLETAAMEAERLAFGMWMGAIFLREGEHRALARLERAAGALSWYRELSTGMVLHRLVELLLGKPRGALGTPNTGPRTATERLENIFLVLAALRSTHAPLYVVGRSSPPTLTLTHAPLYVVGRSPLGASFCLDLTCPA